MVGVDDQLIGKTMYIVVTGNKLIVEIADCAPVIYMGTMH